MFDPRDQMEQIKQQNPAPQPQVGAADFRKNAFGGLMSLVGRAAQKQQNEFKYPIYNEAAGRSIFDPAVGNLALWFQQHPGATFEDYKRSMQARSISQFGGGLPGWIKDQGLPQPGTQGPGTAANASNPNVWGQTSDAFASSPGLQQAMGYNATPADGAGGNTALGPFFDPNYAKNRADLQRQFETAGSGQRATVGAPQIDMAPQDQFRSQQMGLMNTLAQQAAGQGPSLAQSQLRQATDRGLAQTLAMAASQRGVNPAIAARNAMRQQSQIQSDAALASSDLRMREQMLAQQQLGELASSGRQADIGLASQQAGLTLDREKANAQADIAQRQFQDEMRMKYLAMGLDADRANQAAQIDAVKWRDAQRLDEMRIKAGIAGQSAQTGTQAAGATMAGLGAILGAIGSMASDKNLKTNISESSGEIDEFLSSLKPYKYKYKNEVFGKGEHTSVMAQDLEKTKIGKQMVIDTPAGKIVDYGKGLGAILAAQVRLNRRLAALEGK